MASPADREPGLAEDLPCPGPGRGDLEVALASAAGEGRPILSRIVGYELSIPGRSTVY
jgi:hypothetical protein